MNSVFLDMSAALPTPFSSLAFTCYTLTMLHLGLGRHST